MKRSGPGTSTQGSSIDSLRTIPRLPAHRRVAGVTRVHAGEFSSGGVVPGTRYRVVGLVGRGGMGLVYDVEHLELGKRFVLKALLGNHAGRDDLVARLRNEQRALGRLQHPNIVAVTDAGVTSTNIPYFVMERLEGETLGAVLRRQRTLPVLDAIAIARGVLDGLSAAHQIGVVHRDIKPQNIFVLPGNRPKILDFGVAKIADAGSVITKRGVALGTPRYMSPEQVGGESIDGRSDLYSVGLVLFESIAGRGPFDDVREAHDMLVAHLKKPAPRLGAAAGVTPELDALVASLLSKNPAERPPTARAAAAALAAIEQRGQSTSFDAVAPYTSATTSRRTVPQPGGPASALATRPDGVAARDLATIPNGPTANGTTQVMPHTAPGGTLYDHSSRALTVAHSHVPIPSDAYRTERLAPVPFPRAGWDDPTHTRAPTPSEGTVSLAPVPLEGPRSRRSRPVTLLGLVGLAAVLAAGYFVLRGARATTEQSGDAARAPATSLAGKQQAAGPGEPSGSPPPREKPNTHEVPSPVA
ncbi:MAG TPA: protein kinase, partial [Polyangiaceae bacterium]